MTKLGFRYREIGRENDIDAAWQTSYARLEAMGKALAADVRGAEAMLNSSLALDADSPVPDLAALSLAGPVPVDG